MESGYSRRPAPDGIPNDGRRARRPDREAHRAWLVGGGTCFEWSGVRIAARFTGTQVSMQVNDGAILNEFAVVVTMPSF